MSKGAQSATSAAVAAGCDDGATLCCDYQCDLMQETLHEEVSVDQALTAEASANIEINAGLWRHVKASKFRDVDPVEAAATDAILNGVPING